MQGRCRVGAGEVLPRTVIEVSAMTVEIMTFLLPGCGGPKIACCSAVGIRECNGYL